MTSTSEKCFQLCRCDIVVCCAAGTCEDGSQHGTSQGRLSEPCVSRGHDVRRSERPARHQSVSALCAAMVLDHGSEQVPYLLSTVGSAA